jgi:branched-chain amino acid transport system substrate-binding protein
MASDMHMPWGRSACAWVLLGLAAGCARPAAPPGQAGGPAQVEPLVADRPADRVPGSVPVAAIFPTRGRFALSGLQSQNGARLAVDDLNRRGGIHGRPVQLLAYGTGSYFVDARLAASWAAEEGALALVGSNASSLSKAIAEVAEGRQVPQVSNVSTADDLTWDPATGKDREFVFRVCGSDVVMGRLLAELARERLDARRVAILYEVGRDYSARLAKSFRERFQDTNGRRTVAEFAYLPLEIDFSGQLREVAAFRPDVLFVPGSFTDVTLIAIQARRAGLAATLVGGDAWSNRLLFGRGGPATTAYFSDHCAPDPEFAERYRREYGQESDGCRAILAYDAVQAVAAALQALGPLADDALGTDLPATRRRLRDALSAVSFPGETGRIRFDARGDVRRGVALMAVEPAGGGYVTRFQGWLGSLE